MKDKKTIYYNNDFSQDFVSQGKNIRIIDENYKYEHKNIFWKIARFIIYRIFVTPIAFFYCKFNLRLKVANKKALKECKKTGYFIYGNHTHQYSDPFSPNIICFPKKVDMVVHPYNVSIKFLGKITPFLGALPLPSNLKGSRNFLKAMSNNIKKKHCIIIYPEAHIWPYFTKIRPYASTSFKYPIQFNSPSFCFTTTYQQKKHSKKPKVTIFVDGPFYPDKSLILKEQQEDLKNKIYSTMCERSKNSTYEYYNYVLTEDKNNAIEENIKKEDNATNITNNNKDKNNNNNNETTLKQ